MVTRTEPITELDPRYGSPDASATPWADALEVLETAPLFWLATVRVEGGPHVTPLLAVWDDGAMHFCTGEHEQKTRNLAGNPLCTLTTGENRMDGGLDVVVEGRARRVTDHDRLTRLADRYLEKYGEDWHFRAHDGGFSHPKMDTVVPVFAVEPTVAYGFAKGDVPSQTRWRFV